MREIRKGKKVETISGEMYQHHNVWLSPFEQYIVNKLAVDYDMDENHIISKMIEQYIGENVSIGERNEFFKTIVLPKIKDKFAREENGQSRS